MDVRSATREDRARIEAVVRGSLQTSYALSPASIDTLVQECFADEALDERIDDSDTLCLVADDEGVVGFAEVDADSTLRWLHVDPAARGQGAGTSLFARVRQELAEREVPVTARVLEAFASEPSVAPVIVSGRGRDDLRSRVDVDGIAYAGNHGLELADGETETVHPEAARKRPTIARVCDELEDRLADVSGCTVEDKGITATVHFRRAPVDVVPAVVSTVDDVVSGVEGIHVTTGKQIREVSPSVDWNKGRVMERLSRTVPDSWRTVYIGDDRTDEDAFRAIQPDGVGVRVVDAADENPTTTTAARYRTGGHGTVPHLLAWIGMCVGPRPLDARSDPLETVIGFTDT